MSDICQDPTCTNLKCVPPLGQWWLTAPTYCDLVVDEGFAGALQGTIYAQARECTSTDVARVIDTDDDWLIDIHITVSGKILPLLCGRWCISACLENMCGGKTYRFPRDIKDDPPGYCCTLVQIVQTYKDYDAMICVPANVVKPGECGAPYELTVIVNLLSEDQIKKGDVCDPGTYMPLGIATACELPLMTFYTVLGEPL